MNVTWQGEEFCGDPRYELEFDVETSEFSSQH
jgi:hypothetical protein